MIFSKIAQPMGRIVGNFPPRPRLETLHFSAALAGAVTLAAPGVPTPAAFAVFGVLNIRDPSTIFVANVHGMADAGAGTQAVFELWRLDPPSLIPVLLGVCTLVGGSGDYATALFGFLTDDLLNVPAGSYLIVQATTASTGAPYSGYTIDVHFQ